MKTKQIINYIVLTMVSVTLVVFGCRCATSNPDPLAGWKKAYNEQPSQSIEKDYHNFIKALQANGKGQAQVTGYYKNEKGDHLINIEVFEHGQNASWQYALIYNERDVRVKITKYGYCEYKS